MGLVEVTRLQLAGRTVRRPATRLRLEDAIHTEVPDDDRLVLVRRMAVASKAASDRPGERQAAMRQAWLAATGDARHGAQDGAEGANCVWFASEAEAEAVLLERLLAGRPLNAWFWKLAVPHWRGRAPAEWLEDQLELALRPGAENRLVRLVDTCLKADALALLVTAIEHRGWAGPTPGLSGSNCSFDEQGEIAWGAPPHDHAERAAGRIIAATPASLQAFLGALLRIAGASTAALALARGQALRISPALALRPAMLAETVRIILKRLAQVPGASPVRTGSAAKAGRPARPGRLRPQGTSSEPVRAKKPATGTQHRDSEPRTGPVLFARDASEPDRPFEHLQSRSETVLPQRSRHAGLWLIVPALSDMGLRAWLEARSELLGGHPGAQLFRAIARHHRIAAEDPVLAGLPHAEPDLPLPEWTRLWRHGLDRWLRRQARRRLHDLASRPGRLLWSEDALQVSFPVGDADINLRRLALDRDPGWTDWLGLSVRYRFVGEDEQ